MTKAADLLKTEHTKQISWLSNQIKNNKTSIFLNASRAIKAFDDLNSDLILEPKAVESYVFRYLSDEGIKRLVTTLRVSETRRRKSFLTMLQVNLEPKNNSKLTKLAEDTGLSKTDLINRMIECTNFVKKEEEQLEINI
jgi:hypothetical protein